MTECVPPPWRAAAVTALRTHGEDETRRAAARFSRRLLPGDVVALHGELGTGKTRFVQGIAEGFGVTHRVTSPTFTLIQEYAGGRLPLFHFDLYRIDDPRELEEIGYEEYLFGEGVTCIEWAERMGDLLPDRYYRVMLRFGENDEDRLITIEKAEAASASGGRLEGGDRP